MKPVKILLIIIISMTITMCDEKKTGIETNYYDLPKGQVSEMKSILKTDDLNQFTNGSIKVLTNFLSRTVLAGKSPFGPLLTSSYFWHVYNALPSFVDGKERHHGYYSDEKKPGMEKRMLAYACYRINRSPENLKKVFSLARPLMTKTVSPEDYRRMRADNFVNGLIITYERLQRIKDYDIKMSEFYNSRFTQTGAMKTEVEEISKVYNGAYGYSSYDLSEDLNKHLTGDRHSAMSGSPYISFWMRRNKEGNMDAVYAILKEIQQIYNK